MTTRKQSKSLKFARSFEKNIIEVEDILEKKGQELSRDTDVLEGIMLGLLASIVVNIIYSWYKDTTFIKYFEVAIMIIFIIVLGHLMIRMHVRNRAFGKDIASLKKSVLYLKVIKKGRVTQDGKTYIWSGRKR